MENMKKEYKTPRALCVYAMIFVTIVLLVLTAHSLITGQEIFHPQIKTGCVIVTVLSIIAEYYRRKEQKKEE